MSDSSRFTKYSQKKPAAPRKAREIRGEREDQGRYFYCGNCNFRVDSSVMPSGGLNAKDGLSYTSFSVTDTSSIYTQPITLYYPTVSSGCPLCGAPLSK